jgi:MoaA/NifB/PqqE/SkfB family radical SAM enzyme
MRISLAKLRVWCWDFLKNKHMWPFSRKPSPQDEEKLRQYEEAKKTMLENRFVCAPIAGMSVWHVVREVYHDQQGNIGLVFALSFHGSQVLVQRINKDGKISKSPPSWSSKKWYRHDKPFCALCEVCKAEEGHSFAKNGGSSSVRCTSIIEMPTEFLPMMDIHQWTAYVLFPGKCAQRS